MIIKRENKMSEEAEDTWGVAEYYNSCDLQFYLNFTNEIYDLLNYPLWVVLYLTFQFYGLLGIVFSTFALLGNVIKYYYLGFR